MRPAELGMVLLMLLLVYIVHMRSWAVYVGSHTCNRSQGLLHRVLGIKLGK